LGEVSDNEQGRAEAERGTLADADTVLSEAGAMGEQAWTRERDALADADTRPSGADQTIAAAARARTYDAFLRRDAEPRQLGRYVVLDVLGQGGMGVVLRAYDRELDRMVALKLLHDGIDEQHAQRLRREAQAMAKLSHPNVVQVYEVGEVEGQTFVAMELVKGKTLKAWMEQQPRPGWRACVELFMQLGAGLSAAHEQGLVHRDFKPGNAIIDDKGRARVLDFGLARRDDEVEHEPSVMLEKVRTDVHAAVPLETSLTETGTVLGTPAYMPPEQMLGQETDARSDQFSFCVALHEAVYGERPYEGDSMMAMMMSMRSGSVRPVPKGSDVPLALRKVLLRGLAVAAAERWPSMEGLLEELRRVAAPRRRRALVLVVSVGLVAVGGGVGATQTLEWLSRCTGARKQLEGVWDDTRRQAAKAAILRTSLAYAPDTWERVEPRLDEYADAWATEHTEACEATRVRSEQSEAEMSLRMGCLHERRQHLAATVDELARADATVVENAVRAVTSLPGLERCRDLSALRAEVPPPEDPAVAQQVAALDEQLVAAKAKGEAGKYAEGLRLADEVVAQGGTLGYEPLMARAWLRQGGLRERTGDYEGAATALRQAYVAAVAHTMKPEAADASAGLLSIVGDRLARHEEARGWAEHAEPLSRAAKLDEARAKYFSNLGTVAYSQAEYEDARDAHERALAIREKALGSHHPLVAAALNNLGNVALAQAEHEDARDFHGRALAIVEEALGPHHPLVAGSLNNLGNVAMSQGKYAEARDFYERALVVREQALGPDHPNVAISLNNLGNVAQAQGEHEDARAFLERALIILERTLGPAHPDVAFSLNNLGLVAMSQAKYEDARGFHERALAIREEASSPDHPDVAYSLINLGSVAGLQGEYEDARGLYERALAVLEKALGPDHPLVAYPLTGLGEALRSLAEPADALAPLERALIIRTTHEVDPAELAATRFALARVLWDVPGPRGRDRARARALAEQARDAYAAAGEAKTADLAEVRAWLSEHPPQ